jgi:hypothetical protein
LPNPLVGLFEKVGELPANRQFDNFPPPALTYQLAVHQRKSTHQTQVALPTSLNVTDH